MHPSCLEAHATPRHESGDRAPCNPPSTRQHPRRRRALPRCRARSTRTHMKRKQKKGRKDRECQEKWRKQRTAGKVRQVMKGGDFEVGALRGQGCTNRGRSGSGIQVSSSYGMIVRLLWWIHYMEKSRYVKWYVCGMV